MTKVCTKCGIEKPLTTEFFQLRPQRKCGWCSSCRECNKKTSQAWKEVNPKRTRELSRKSAKDFYKRFPERGKENAKRSIYRRLETEPMFRLVRNLRRRINKAIKNQSKSRGTRKLLGCSVEFFRSFIQAQFKSGMTWKNYGSLWVLDHVVPCSHFDLSRPQDQSMCFGWSNHQPLFAKDNLQKSDTFVG